MKSINVARMYVAIDEYYRYYVHASFFLPHEKTNTYICNRELTIILFYASILRHLPNRVSVFSSVSYMSDFSES